MVEIDHISGDPLADLKELAYLAHEHKDQNSRRTLLRRLTEVFMGGPGKFTDQQRQYFGDIFENLAYDLEWQVRAELARRIAAEPEVPRSLILRLADDEIPIARPVLEESPVLTECDLVDLSERKSQEHLLAITKRMELGNRLCAALVKHGGDDVVESLVRNDNALIAPDIVGQIADRAIRSETLQAALVDRRSVPREILVGLLEHVSDRLKQTILDGLSEADRQNLDDILHSMKLTIEGTEKSEAERYIDDLQRRGTLNEGMVIRFAFEKRPMVFLLAIARLVQVDASTAQRILTDKTGQALLVACRSSGFSIEAFKEMLMSPLTAVAGDLHQVHELVRIYRRLTKDNAQRAMRHLRTRKFAMRAGADRRSGRDTRSEDEKATEGERRSGRDRRAESGSDMSTAQKIGG